MHFETQAIRLQQNRTVAREHSAPIYPTSSFVFDDAEHMRATFAAETGDNIYSRFTNPNYRELEVKMAALEKTEDACATATGMAATFAAFMSNLSAGDHILLSRAIFGSTYQQALNYLPKWGITHSFVDPEQPETWEEAVQVNTKFFYCETPSNPGLAIIDIQGAANFCKAHDLLLIVDNCFATPYLQQPTVYGADLIIHSATKFIDGQGRVLGGIVCGRKDLVEEVRKFCRNTGPAISPFNAWIISKSLETLHVRMDRHCENALFIAQQLEGHPEVSRVNYPFLSSHPGSEIAKKQMRAGGGIVTFELKGGLEKGQRFLDQLEWLSLSANLGDTRTIASHPASTTHAKLTEEARLAVGITNGLVRLSVGLEHREDILSDVLQALSS